MIQDYNRALWALGIDNPYLQESISHAIAGEESSIPTRRVSAITGELEDIHINYLEIEDEVKQEYLGAILKKIDSLTLKDLAQELNKLSIYLRVKEATGEELTPEEKTLKDIDITALALYAILHLSKLEGEKEEKE